MSDDLLRYYLREADPRAMDLLWQQLGDRLHAYLVAMCGDYGLADEALQDGFISLARNSERLAAAQSIDAYCFRTVRNAALQILRRRQPVASPVTLVDVPAAEPVDPELRAQLSLALAGLPIDQREVVALKVWDGMTFAAIAELMDISLNTAASRYRYAMEKLRQQIGNEHHV